MHIHTHTHARARTHTHTHTHAHTHTHYNYIHYWWWVGRMRRQKRQISMKKRWICSRICFCSVPLTEIFCKNVIRRSIPECDKILKEIKRESLSINTPRVLTVGRNSPGLHFASLQFNPFVAIISLENDSSKCKIWNPLAFLSSFSHFRVKGLLSKGIILNVNVIGPDNILFAGASMHVSVRKMYRLGQWRG